LIVDAVRRLACAKPILINFAYGFPEIMSPDNFAYRMYVCVDEFPRMWRSRTQPFALKFQYQSRLHQHYENQVALRANRCLATHVPLVDKLRHINASTSLFLHGQEFDTTARPRAEKKPGGSLTVGFMGFITYNLLVEWLEAVVDAADLHLSLIGPVHNFTLKTFSPRNNFSYYAPLSQAKLLNTLGDMDVLVMPYDPCIPEVRVQTASNKFFQYVAAGRPVVISDMPHYIEMPPGVIYRARTAKGFVEKIRQAYTEDCQEFVDLRLKIAAENTWDKRGDVLHSIIQQDMHGMEHAPGFRDQAVQLRRGN